MPLIYINAPIGSGKTELANLLGERLGEDVYLENVGDMPMLTKFYEAGEESRRELSFKLQIAFLNYRYAQLRKGLYQAHVYGKQNSVYDSSLLSDGLMVENLYQRGEFSSEERDLYLELSQNMQANVSGFPFSGKPSLVVFINTSFETMLSRIQHRGREMETTDPELLDYYRGVWNVYQNWYKGNSELQVLSIDGDKYDYVNSESDREIVLTQITDRLHELGNL